MSNFDVNFIKKCIYVYYNKELDSLGIYLASSKEDAVRDIYREFWDNIPDTFYEDITLLGGTINVFDSIEVWSWEEYQEMQGFKVSKRLLEISH